MKTALVPTIPLVPLLCLLALSGCASLTHGWARLDVPEGRIKPMMLCRFTVDKDGDLEARCLSLDEVRRQLAEEEEAERKSASEL